MNSVGTVSVCYQNRCRFQSRRVRSLPRWTIYYCPQSQADNHDFDNRTTRYDGDVSVDWYHHSLIRWMIHQASVAFMNHWLKPYLLMSGLERRSRGNQAETTTPSLHRRVIQFTSGYTNCRKQPPVHWVGSASCGPPFPAQTGASSVRS